MSSESSIIFSMLIPYFPSTICSKDCSVCHWIVLVPRSKSIECESIFPDYQFFSLGLYVYPNRDVDSLSSAPNMEKFEAHPIILSLEPTWCFDSIPKGLFLYLLCSLFLSIYLGANRSISVFLETRLCIHYVDLIFIL